MRFFARRVLREFWENPGHEDAEIPLKTWIAVVEAAHWNTPHDVKAQYSDASIISSERVVFNIGGNKYRIIAAIDYAAGVLLVKFIGTHTEYDKMDARTYGI